MSTLYTYRLLSGFGDATSAEVGAFVEFAILWDGDTATMPGWEQPSQVSTYHVPGGNTNLIFLMGLGELTRTFTVLCPTKTAYTQLAALQQTQGTLRVPAAMNELGIATEVDNAGTLVADIPDVVLVSLSAPGVWTDGCISTQAAFWREGRD
mgnify:CR=1 FL=1